MSTIINTDLTHDLLGLVAHFRVQPRSVPENLTAMIRWAAMGSHYLVSGCLLLVFGAKLTVGIAAKCDTMGGCKRGPPFVCQ